MRNIDFFLCSEDVETIRSNKRYLRHIIFDECVAVLREYSRKDVMRRDHGMLGSNFIKACGLSSVNCRDVEFYFDQAVSVRWPFH